jgi:mannan endo-1,4-beta-mannosidase
MKEQMGRNQRSQRSFLHTDAAVHPGASSISLTDPRSALAAEHTQNQKAAHASFVGRSRTYVTLIGIFAIILATFLIMQPFYPARSVHAAGSVGFHISGRSLRDVHGNNFIMRGISHGYAWYLSQNTAFANIKATGANTVRVVLSGGSNGGAATSLANVKTAINLCKTNKLVCVLEDHDTTGYNDHPAATLAQAVSYWKSLQSVLTGQENWVIINIGNEPWGNSNPSGWTSATKNAIVAMRNAGFEHTLMVDAPNWGQDNSHTMLNNAKSVEATDSMHNTIFSVHMYGVYGSASTVDSYISSFYNTGMPLVIGEFGATQSGSSSSDNANQIMADAQSRGIGYMGWSWSGNGSPVQYLDMVKNFNPGQRTAWGTRIITGANGIKQTSHQCLCY